MTTEPMTPSRIPIRNKLRRAASQRAVPVLLEWLRTGNRDVTRQRASHTSGSPGTRGLLPSTDRGASAIQNLDDAHAEDKTNRNRQDLKFTHRDKLTCERKRGRPGVSRRLLATPAMETHPSEIQPGDFDTRESGDTPGPNQAFCRCGETDCARRTIPRVQNPIA